jgi:hypothetical protein
MNHPSPSSCETRVSRPYQIITLMLHSLPPHWLCCCGCCISITVNTQNKANVRQSLQGSNQQELYSKSGNLRVFHNVATIVFYIVIFIKFHLGSIIYPYKTKKAPMQESIISCYLILSPWGQQSQSRHKCKLFKIKAKFSVSNSETIILKRNYSINYEIHPYLD